MRRRGAARPVRQTRLAALLAIAAATAAGVSAQALRLPRLLPAASPAATPAPAATPPLHPIDPLERDTPRGAVRGFLRAAHMGRFDLAARYLRLRPASEAGEPVAPAVTARHLAVVLGRRLPIDLEALSDAPEGSDGDGLAPHRERVGTIASGRGAVDILLDRVSGLEPTPVWLIASRTVDQVPRLYEEFGDGRIGEVLPPVFFAVQLLGLALWQWLGLGLVLLIAMLAGYLVRRFGMRAALAIARRTPTAVDDRLVEALQRPIGALSFVLLFELGCLALTLPLEAQARVDALVKALIIAGVAWAGVNALDALAGLTAARLLSRGHEAARSLLPLGRRTLQALVVLTALIALLDALGVNAGGLVAGLGIGGLAVALGAQKTLENFFGGLSLALDQPVRVGDSCRFGEQVGTVEDIGLRSTRIRTPDRTVVTVPNAQLAAMTIENLSRRDRMRLTAILALRPETAPERMRGLVAALGQRLARHPQVNPGSAWVRFTGFAAASLSVQIEALLRVTAQDEFNAAREDLLLQAIEVMREQGCELAPGAAASVPRDGRG